MMRGKVVLVPFPFDDLSTTKVRPAVCLTDLIGTHDRVTSDIHASVLHRLMTVTTALVRRELGGLSPRMQDEVANRLRRLFGLA